MTSGSIWLLRVCEIHFFSYSKAPLCFPCKAAIACDSQVISSKSPGASRALLGPTARAVLRGQMLKLSAQSHVPLMFGLLNTNSLVH